MSSTDEPPDIGSPASLASHAGESINPRKRKNSDSGPLLPCSSQNATADELAQLKEKHKEELFNIRKELEIAKAGQKLAEDKATAISKLAGSPYAPPRDTSAEEFVEQAKLQECHRHLSTYTQVVGHILAHECARVYVREQLGEPDEQLSPRQDEVLMKYLEGQPIRDNNFTTMADRMANTEMVLQQLVRDWPIFATVVTTLFHDYCIAKDVCCVAAKEVWEDAFRNLGATPGMSGRDDIAG